MIDILSLFASVVRDLWAKIPTEQCQLYGRTLCLAHWYVFSSPLVLTFPSNWHIL